MTLKNRSADKRIVRGHLPDATERKESKLETIHEASAHTPKFKPFTEKETFLLKQQVKKLQDDYALEKRVNARLIERIGQLHSIRSLNTKLIRLLEQRVSLTEKETHARVSLVEKEAHAIVSSVEKEAHAAFDKKNKLLIAERRKLNAEREFTLKQLAETNVLLERIEILEADKLDLEAQLEGKATEVSPLFIRKQSVVSTDARFKKLADASRIEAVSSPNSQALELKGESIDLEGAKPGGPIVVRLVSQYYEEVGSEAVIEEDIVVEAESEAGKEVEVESAAEVRVAVEAQWDAESDAEAELAELAELAATAAKQTKLAAEVWSDSDSEAAAAPRVEVDVDLEADEPDSESHPLSTKSSSSQYSFSSEGSDTVVVRAKVDKDSINANASALFAKRNPAAPKPSYASVAAKAASVPMSAPVAAPGKRA